MRTNAFQLVRGCRDPQIGYDAAMRPVAGKDVAQLGLNVVAGIAGTVTNEKREMKVTFASNSK